jgi:hypothetical protein
MRGARKKSYLALAFSGVKEKFRVCGGNLEWRARSESTGVTLSSGGHFKIMQKSNCSRSHLRLLSMSRHWPQSTRFIQFSRRSCAENKFLRSPPSTDWERAGKDDDIIFFINIFRERALTRLIGRKRGVLCHVDWLPPTFFLIISHTLTKNAPSMLLPPLLLLLLLRRWLYQSERIIKI